MSLHDLPRDIVINREGPQAWLRRIKCWWRGAHDWNKKDQKYPYPLRPKYCVQCGAKWTYFTCVIPPARYGRVHKECPKCWMLTEHDPDEAECKCHECGWVFPVQSRALHTCAHCSGKVYLGENCKGCGAPA